MRLYRALKNSISGINYAINNEKAFRLEFIILLLSFPLSIMIGSNYFDIFFMNASIVFIIIIELINTAIEKACDAITKENVYEIKIAKDCGSSAVLIATVLSFSIWAYYVLLYMKTL